MVFQTTMPSVGPGRLKNREDPAVLGTDKEVKLLDPADNFYRGIAVNASQQQVAFDIWAFRSVAAVGLSFSFVVSEGASVVLMLTLSLMLLLMLFVKIIDIDVVVSTPPLSQTILLLCGIAIGSPDPFPPFASPLAPAISATSTTTWRPLRTWRGTPPATSTSTRRSTRRATGPGLWRS